MNCINLFNSKLVKSISCDKPQRDRFEAKNLIKDESNAGLNFYSGYFIKCFYFNFFTQISKFIFLI